VGTKLERIKAQYHVTPTELTERVYLVDHGSIEEPCGDEYRFLPRITDVRFTCYDGERLVFRALGDIVTIGDMTVFDTVDGDRVSVIGNVVRVVKP